MESILYAMLKSAALGVSLLPLGLARGMGRALGRALMAGVKDRREHAINSLALSFPERDEAWARQTARQSFEHMAMVAMETCHLARLSADRIRALAPPAGLEHAQNALAQGRGLLMLTGHLGNWEWCGTCANLQVGPTMVVGRPLDFAPGDRLSQFVRTRFGNQVVPKARSFRPLLRTLRQGKPIGILGDQNVDWYDGVWVDFFGRPACTNKGTALLAMASRAPVVPVFCRRAPGGFVMEYQPAIPPAETGDKTQDIWDNTQAYTRAIENMIRRAPGQWLWVHKRWKTKPSQPWPRKEKK